MRRTWRRGLAAAVVVLAVGAVAVVIGTTSGPATTSGSGDVIGSSSLTVTVPAGPSAAGSDQPTDTGGASPTSGVWPTASYSRSPDLSDGDRDYSVDPTPDDAAADPPGAEVDSTPWPPPPADPTAPVAVAVADAAAVGVHQAVVVINRADGVVLTQQNADEQFAALSLLKLMIAADVLNGSDDAPPLNEPTLAWLREMIARSDDVTASDFYERLGGDEMVDRVVLRYGLTGSAPTPDGEYWGNVQITGADMASLLAQLLADPATGPVIGSAMQASTAIAQDGVDQRFGMRTVPGAGSKQGWGCCLSGVTGVHSVGFTPERIVVVLSSAEPDDYSLGEQDGLALQADPAAQVSMATVTNTVRAALGMPVTEIAGPAVPRSDPAAGEAGSPVPEDPPADDGPLMPTDSY